MKRGLVVVGSIVGVYAWAACSSDTPSAVNGGPEAGADATVEGGSVDAAPDTRGALDAAGDVAPEAAGDSAVADAGADADADADGAVDGAAPDALADGRETFSDLYVSVLMANGCAPHHSNPNPFGGLDMSTQGSAYANLVGVPAGDAGCGTRVVAGDASASLLYQKVRGTQPVGCGAQMPLNAPPISAADMDKIRAWIDQGARDD